MIIRCINRLNMCENTVTGDSYSPFLLPLFIIVTILETKVSDSILLFLVFLLCLSSVHWRWCRCTNKGLNHWFTWLPTNGSKFKLLCLTKGIGVVVLFNCCLPWSPLWISKSLCKMCFGADSFAEKFSKICKNMCYLNSSCLIHLVL